MRFTKCYTATLLASYPEAHMYSGLQYFLSVCLSVSRLFWLTCLFKHYVSSWLYYCFTRLQRAGLPARTQKIMKREQTAHILLAVEDPRQKTIELKNRWF